MKIDLTNYVPLMCTIMIIMAILLIVMSIGLLRMKSQYKSQRKLVKIFAARDKRHVAEKEELKENVKAVMAMLYDVVLSEHSEDMEYRASVIRSSLFLLGMENGFDDLYKLGTFCNILELGDAHSISKFVHDLTESVLDYDHGTSMTFSKDTESKLNRFMRVIDSCYGTTDKSYEKEDIATNDVAADPHYIDTMKARVLVTTSERAAAMFAE